MEHIWGPGPDSVWNVGSGVPPGVQEIIYVDLHRVGRKGLGRPFCGPPPPDISAQHCWGEMSRWDSRDSPSLTRPHARYTPTYQPGREH